MLQLALFILVGMTFRQCYPLISVNYLLPASKRSTDSSYLDTGNVPKHYENKNNCLLVLRIASVFKILMIFSLCL